jgi:hypothetical protein
VRRLADWLLGLEYEPEVEPPWGYVKTGCTIAEKQP